jgi:hypothetical protein
MHFFGGLLCFAGAVAGPGASIAHQSSQSPKAATLLVTVTLADAGGKVHPVAGHVMRLDTEPSTGSPQRVVIDADGRAELTLPGGSYVLESARPAELHGRTYRWAARFELRAGGTVSLNLTAENAIADTLSKDLGPDPMLTEWNGTYAGYPATLSLDRLQGPAYRGTLYLVTKKGAPSTEVNVELRVNGEDVGIQEVGAVRLSGVRFWYLGSGTGKLEGNMREMSGTGKNSEGNKFKWSFARK